jgi:hypothetical protein
MRVSDLQRLKRYLKEQGGKAARMAIVKEFGWSDDKLARLIDDSDSCIKRAHYGRVAGIALIGSERGQRGGVPLYRTCGASWKRPGHAIRAGKLPSRSIRRSMEGQRRAPGRDRTVFWHGIRPAAAAWTSHRRCHPMRLRRPGSSTSARCTRPTPMASAPIFPGSCFSVPPRRLRRGCRIPIGVALRSPPRPAGPGCSVSRTPAMPQPGRSNGQRTGAPTGTASSSSDVHCRLPNGTKQTARSR